ncbi:MAG: hypothetical protein ACFB6S_13255 [Geminicoccaceae bacterium]
MRVVALLLAITVLFSTWPASAEPYVVVNGQRLSFQQIQEVEAMACTRIANGRYWYDATSGFWGYEGNPTPVSHIKYCCYNQCNRPSLSQSGRLFGPGDWLRDTYRGN